MGKVNGDVDVRERANPERVVRFRAQGSKQGRACRGLSDWDAVFALSRVMGTSVAQIDATYGHLVPDSDEYLRGLLDYHDVAASNG